MMSDVRDNTEQDRYELEQDGMIAFADYRRSGNSVRISHVEAPIPLRGTGAADRLMRGITDIARRDGLTIVPLCSYAAAWMRRHKEVQDLLG